MSLVFNKYERIRRIAQGGMGEVFLARQTGVLDRLAILKSLRYELVEERDFVDQFLDEARVAATLNHPNIVAIYDVGEWDATYYIAMEFVAGEDLSKLWYAAAKAGVGLPFQVSVRICYEAALGLDHAHRAKDVRGNPLTIVHRDVSPQNIMVRGDGVVKLVDFGIAKAANKASRTQAGMVKGKLQYMSPEQVRGEILDRRSDQFSLGIVLWEMCTGRRLFKAESEIQTLEKILHAPIPRPSVHVPGFPAELESTIMRMLDRDVERRYRSLGEAASDLKGYLDRASLQNGEVTVASFVQQILGKELEERIADLTPMDPEELDGDARRRASRPTDPVARASTPTPDRPRGSGGTSSRPQARPDVARPSGAMSSPRGAATPARPAGVDGLSPFKDDQDTLVLAQPLGKALRDGADGMADGNLGGTSGGTRPGNLGEKSDGRLDANLDEKADGRLGGFSLGEIPPAHTSIWEAPETSAAKAGPEAEARTPPARLTPMQGAAPVPRRLPTAAWLVAGLLGAMVVVVAGLAVVAPEVLRVVIRPSGSTEDVRQALHASRGGDPAAIDAVLPAFEAVAEGPAATVSALAAAAILHVERARIADQAHRLHRAVLSLGGEAQRPEGAPDDHRGKAYRYLTAALRLDADAAAVHLGLALHHAEKGARTELSAEGRRARIAANGTAFAPEVERELAVAEGLATASAALDGKSAEDARQAADALANLAPDPRAAMLALVVRAHAVALETDADKRRDDVEKLRRAGWALNETAGDDPRPGLALAVVKVIERARPEPTEVAAAPRPAAPEPPPVTEPPAATAEATDVPPPITPRVTEEAAPPAVPPDAPASATAALAPSSSVPSAGPPATVSSGSPPNATGPVTGPNAPGPGAEPSTSAASASSGPPSSAAPPAPSAPSPGAGAAPSSPEVVATEPTFEALVARGAQARKERRPHDAIAAYRQALERRPGVTSVQMSLAWSQMDVGEHAEAEALFARVAAKEGAPPEVFIGLGEARKAEGKTEAAREAYQAYLERAPDGPDADLARRNIAALE